MKLIYKSSQATTKLFRSEYNRIPKEQVQENTSSLLEYIDKIDLSDQGINENIHTYEEKIINLLQKGAKITALTHNNALLQITHYYFRLLAEIKRTRPYLQNSFDPFLEMLMVMSSSNDEESMKCAQNSEFHQFLTEILLSTKEVQVLQKVIKIIYNFVYEKPLTADVFNCDAIIKSLYSNYNEYFFMGRSDKFVGETNQNNIIQNVIFPSFELILVFYIHKTGKTDPLDDLSFRLIASIENILKKHRSNNNEELYISQVKMILSQLQYILSHANDQTVQFFSTLTIIQACIDNISYGDEISISALECLKEYSLRFASAYYIIRPSKDETMKTFNTYLPSESSFSQPEKFIDAIITFCQIWINVIMSVLAAENIQKGRLVSAKISIQKNAQKILEFLQNTSKAQKNIRCQQMISRTFVAFANFNDDNILDKVVKSSSTGKHGPRIIKKISRVLEERNPDDIVMITKGIINVIDFYTKNGSKIEQIGKDLAIYKDDILAGLNEVRESYESSIPQKVEDLDRDINRIKEMFAQIFPK